MELRELEAFVVVATHGSYTRAARVLRFDQSTVSRHVQQLERDIGITLLVRNSRTVQLTDAGRQWLPQAKRVLDAAKRAAEQAAHLAGR